MASKLGPQMVDESEYNALHMGFGSHCKITCASFTCYETLFVGQLEPKNLFFMLF